MSQTMYLPASVKVGIFGFQNEISSLTLIIGTYVVRNNQVLYIVRNVCKLAITFPLTAFKNNVWFMTYKNISKTSKLKPKISTGLH